jgi:hypothetical protein
MSVHPGILFKPTKPLRLQRYDHLRKATRFKCADYPIKTRAFNGQRPEDNRSNPCSEGWGGTAFSVHFKGGVMTTFKGLPIMA